MKRYSPLVILMFFVVGCSSSPTCDTSQPSSQWHNCSGSEVIKGKLTYIGEWKYGLYNGKGVVETASGNKIVGEFKNSRIHGQATFTYADGEIIKGIWKNGELVEAN